jgi:hypothetical protein
MIFFIFFTQLFISSSLASPCTHFLARQMDELTLISARSRDDHAGFLHYFLESPEEAYVEIVHVSLPYRRQGVSRELFLRLVRREPSVRVIQATLMLDNFTASGLYSRSQAVSFEECVNAIERTPFVKAWRSLGFNGVLECTHDPLREFIRVRLSK